MTYSNPEAYESFMGRWSAQLAPMFLRFVSLQEGQRVLDVGCGTGVLARAALAAGKSIEVTGVDPVESYIAFARSAGNSRASYQVATAESLPFPQGAFDTTLCLLVLQEFEDPDRAIDEMARVTRPMGKVAACQWDFRSGMPMMAMFWEAAALLDPEEVARRQVAARPLRNADVTDLAMRWARAGLRDVRTTSIEFGMPFRTFEDFWIPFTSALHPCRHSRLSSTGTQAANSSASIVSGCGICSETAHLSLLRAPWPFAGMLPRKRAHLRLLWFRSPG